MRDVTVIADDLTGAADCGIAFAIAGLPTFVSFTDAEAPARAQIVAVDTDSRAVTPEEAAGRALAAARRAIGEGTRTLYKKIDSTLRGHVGVEVAAVARASGDAPLLVIAPAFPGTGRTVVDGEVRVGGERLETTEVWRKSGMTGRADLRSMLAAAGIEATVARRGDELRLEGQAVICDAESEDDLARIADAGARLARPIVWVGSAGLARHLPRALGLVARVKPARPGLERQGRPILTLIGSRSSIGRAQAKKLGAEPGMDSIVIDDPAEADRALALTLRQGRDAVVVTALGENVDLAEAPRIARELAELARAHAGEIGGLVATGGDIARATLAALGATGVHLLGEVEPGVPLGLAALSPLLPIVTKAGAFGTPETLVRARAALRNLEGERE